MRRPWFAALTPLLLAGAGCYQPVDQPQVTRMIRIRGGTFDIGGGNAALRCDGKDRPQRCDAMEKTPNPAEWIEHLTWVPQATVKDLPDFDIDEHEVTNAQYRYCAEVGPCTEPASTEVEGTDYYGELMYERHPVVHVSRAQAQAYCQYMGRTLPTEAQWERAARLGPAPGYKMQIFPWGGDIDSACTPGEARYAVTRDCATEPPAVDYSNGDRTSHEVRNMASNVAEWVRDDWSLYGYCAKAAGYDYKCQLDGTRCQTCIDDEKIAKGTCAQSCAPLSLVLCTSGGTYKPVLTGDQTNAGVVRGGDFRHDKCFHRLYVRRKGNGAQPHVGFRCARAVRKP